MQDKLDVLILGCGYTAQRVTKRFLTRGARVTATARNPPRLAGVGVEVVSTNDCAAHVRPGMLVAHSIPPDGQRDLLYSLRHKASRLVYLSSTAVERGIAEGPWPSLILRAAAIYGPGRGIHESVKHGEHSLSDRLVSRIHVDDLAAHAEAAPLSTFSGASPVAGAEPCTSREIPEFCARLLNLKVTGGGQGEEERTPRFANNRRVTGPAVGRALGIALTYPSYRVGVPGALTAEASPNTGYRQI